MNTRRLSTDILGIFSARVVWTLLGTLTGVVLARKLGPQDRGVLALVLLVPSTVVTFVKLGITQANVYFINRERVPAQSVASNSVLLAVVMGGTAAAIVWALQDSLLVSALKGMAPWALAFAVVRVPLILLDDYLYGVLQAGGHFQLYNTRLVVSEVLRLVLICAAFFVFHMGLFAAVAIHTLVNVFNLTWLLATMHAAMPFRPGFDPGLLRKQLGFGFRSYVQTLTGHMLLRSDVYLVNYYLDHSQVAFYSLALRFTEMVLEIPQAVGLVLYPRLASLPEHQVHRLTAQACRRTVLLTSICAVALVLFGPWIIVLWYGAAYAPAGEPLFWAAIGALSMSIFVILTRDFTSQNRQAVNIAAGLPALVTNVVLNVILIPRMGIVGAAMSTALAYSSACAILLFFFLPRAKLSLREVLVATSEDLHFFRELLQRVFRRARFRRPARRGDAG